MKYTRQSPSLSWGCYRVKRRFLYGLQYSPALDHWFRDELRLFFGSHTLLLRIRWPWRKP